MSEKTILITGATSGIGMDTAFYLYELGYKLLLTGRNEERLKEVSEKTGNSPYYALDLINTERIVEIADYCKANDIHLDGMVHSAGLSAVVLTRNYRIKDATQLFAVNYLAFVELCKCLYKKRILNDSGSIVALSSMASLNNEHGAVLYASSKSALNSAVVVIAKEFAKKKIRVNALLPSYVDTNMTKSLEGITDIQEMQHFGFIPARDISYAIEFLLSDKSTYITGALIPISAGM